MISIFMEKIRREKEKLGVLTTQTTPFADFCKRSYSRRPR
jgi:hypothetical protein